MMTAFLFVLLCVTVPGEAARFQSRLVESILKRSSNDCPSATDLQCPRKDINFWLYTRSTQHNPTQLDQFDLDSLKTAPFVEAPLKVIVHGYSVDKDTAVNAVLRPAYFAQDEYNIVSIDWSPLGQDPCYVAASQSVPTIGHCLAQFLSALLAARHFSSVHLLGHSMGAHITSYASHELPLPLLTQFDPALPLFDDKSKLLKKGVAGFVDVYYSNCDVKGRRSPDGYSNVYFNNNIFQPGCRCDTGCSHLRAVQYYAESISNPEGMKAFPCASWSDYKADKCPVPDASELVTVGANIDTSKSGSYMMFTNDTSPFFLDPEVYLDETSFFGFKKTANSDCRINDVLDALKGVGRLWRDYRA